MHIVFVVSLLLLCVEIFLCCKSVVWTTMNPGLQSRRRGWVGFEYSVLCAQFICFLLCTTSHRGCFMLSGMSRYIQQLYTSIYLFSSGVFFLNHCLASSVLLFVLLMSFWGKWSTLVKVYLKNENVFLGFNTQHSNLPALLHVLKHDTPHDKWQHSLSLNSQAGPNRTDEKLCQKLKCKCTLQ